MRILIEDKDIVVSTTRVFTTSIDAALYLSQINEDWKMTAGTSEKAQKLHAQIAVKMINVARQLHRGLLGPGDDVTFEFDGMRCDVSMLEDHGKHTGSPWVNSYPFGPLTKIVALSTSENAGWPNYVGHMVPVGVGHDPSGNQY